MSTVLSEDLLVDILSERFQSADCHRGIVIDSLDTLFAQNNLMAATAVLKAFNNRRYIYFVTIKSDFQKYKEQLNKVQQEKSKRLKIRRLTFSSVMSARTCLILFKQKNSKSKQRARTGGTALLGGDGRGDV